MRLAKTLRKNLWRLPTRIFAGECKYRAKLVDAPVYFGLKGKVSNAAEIKKVFPSNEVIYC